MVRRPCWNDRMRKAFGIDEKPSSTTLRLMSRITPVAEDVPSTCANVGASAYTTP